jgi:hypothetical protein
LSAARRVGIDVAVVGQKKRVNAAHKFTAGTFSSCTSPGDPRGSR